MSVRRMYECGGSSGYKQDENTSRNEYMHNICHSMTFNAPWLFYINCNWRWLDDEQHTTWSRTCAMEIDAQSSMYRSINVWQNEIYYILHISQSDLRAIVVAVVDRPCVCVHVTCVEHFFFLAVILPLLVTCRLVCSLVCSSVVVVVFTSPRSAKRMAKAIAVCWCWRHCLHKITNGKCI